MNRSEIGTRTAEFTVPLAPCWEAIPGALADAIADARLEFRTRNRIPPMVDDSDTDLEVVCHEGEIVVRIKIAEDQR